MCQLMQRHMSLAVVVVLFIFSENKHRLRLRDLAVHLGRLSDDRPAGAERLGLCAGGTAGGCEHLHSAGLRVHRGPAPE